MKIFVVTLLLVIAGAYALPQQDVEQIKTGDQRFIITNQIRKVIEQISQQIRLAGIDPLAKSNASFEYKIPFLVEIKAFVNSLVFTGASNIVVNKLSLNPVFRRLNIELSLPELRLTILNAGFDATLFGNKESGRFGGSISIKQIRLVGEVRYRAGLLIGFKIQRVNLKFSLRSIESDVRLNAFGHDFSENLNTFLTRTVPDTLKKYQNDINKRLEELIMGVLNSV